MAQAQPAPPPAPAVPTQKSGLAVTSLVLGIVSFFCFGPLCAIPAVITGHIALSRTRREPQVHAGQGAAVAGLILGYVNLVLFIIVVAIVMPAIMLPALARSRGAAQRASCANNLKQMGIVLKMFASESKGEHFPELPQERGRLMCANESSCSRAPLWPEYLTDLSTLLCPGDDDASLMDQPGADSNPELLLDDHSYFYLGYAVTNDEEMLAFAEAYQEGLSKGLPFDRDLTVPEGSGTGGGNSILCLREGIERFLVTNINNPAASWEAQAQIPVFIERPGNHAPGGGNVLYMDGHVEFLPYPGRWPMTTTTMNALESLDAL